MLEGVIVDLGKDIEEAETEVDPTEIGEKERLKERVEQTPKVLKPVVAEDEVPKDTTRLDAGNSGGVS